MKEGHLNYNDAIKRVKRSGFRGGYIILEVSFRGLLLENELSQMQDAFNVLGKSLRQLLYKQDH